MTRPGRFPLDLALLSGGFFFIFLGPGAIQQHLDKILGDKRFYVLATVYLSFCFWRVFIATTMDWLGDWLSEVLGAATYVLFVATMLVSTSWPAVLAAALVWGWGASSLWITSQSQLLDAMKRYGAASGLFYSCLTGGQALGVALLALVAAGWRGGSPNQAILVISAVLGLPGLLLIARVPRRRVERQRFSFAGFWAIARQRTLASARCGAWHNADAISVTQCPIRRCDVASRAAWGRGAMRTGHGGHEATEITRLTHSRTRPSWFLGLAP